MWQITIVIIVGDYEHEEYLYYMGTRVFAYKYATKYLSTIWGENETEWDSVENSYVSKDGERSARLYSVVPYDSIEAGTPEGKQTFQLLWVGLSHGSEEL